MSALIDKASQLDELLHTAVQDDEQNGVFVAAATSSTNADLFDLEMKHIFESNWVYLAHESQIPNNNDYYTTWIGRQPWSSRATKAANCMPSSTPAHTRARCCAVKSTATKAPSRALSTAGASPTRASC